MDHSPSGGSEIPTTLAPKILSMMKSLDDLQMGLDPLIQKPHHEAFTTLSPLEKAKILLLEGYAINSLFWALIKISSETDTHKIEEDHKHEMKRYKEVQNRLAEIEARSRMQRIDRGAVKRFVQHGLGKSFKRKSPTLKDDNCDVAEDGHQDKSKTKKKSKIQDDIDASWQ